MLPHLKSSEGIGTKILDDTPECDAIKEGLAAECSADPCGEWCASGVFATVRRFQTVGWMRMVVSE